MKLGTKPLRIESNEGKRGKKLEIFFFLLLIYFKKINLFHHKGSRTMNNLENKNWWKFWVPPMQRLPLKDKLRLFWGILAWWKFDRPQFSFFFRKILCLSSQKTNDASSTQRNRFSWQESNGRGSLNVFFFFLSWTWLWGELLCETSKLRRAWISTVMSNCLACLSDTASSNKTGNSWPLATFNKFYWWKKASTSKADAQQEGQGQTLTRQPIKRRPHL